MAKFSFAFILTAFFLIAVYGDAFLDNSQDNCIGSIKKSALEENWTKYLNITDSYLCLKTCMRKHERAKTAAYGLGNNCFCSHLSSSEIHLDKNSTKCHPDERGTQLKTNVYNMSGLTVRIRFDDYIEQNFRFQVDVEVLLYQNGTSINDSRILNDLLPKNSCNVITKNGQSTDLTCCLEYFRFNFLGKNQICFESGTKSSMCKSVTVLKQIEIDDIELSPGYHGLLVHSRIRGTVFNLSFSLDGRRLESVNAFDKYGEILFKICEIRWEFVLPAKNLGLKQSFMVYASNPLNPVGASKNRTFKFHFPTIDLRVSHVFHVMSNETEITIAANKHFKMYDGLRYKWSLQNCTNENVTLLQYLTDVPRVAVLTPSCDLVHVTNSQELPSKCKIIFTPLGKDGSTGSSKSKTLVYRSPPGKAEYAIEYRPTNYFERGREATFTVKTHKCFHPPQKIIYIWKLNGNEMSRKPIFKHRFNGSGSYIVSLFGGMLNTNAEVLLVSKNISVLEKLTKLEIFVVSFRYFGTPVTMRAVVNSNESVIYIWDFGDGEKYNTTSNTIEHRYNKSGIYTVHVVASNGISKIEANKTINETELCTDSEFETSFEDGKEVQQFRSLPVHLEVSTKKLVCLEPVGIVFRWTFFNWSNELTKWRRWEKLTFNESTNTIYIPPNVLSYGKYRFNVTVDVTGFGVSHYENFSIVVHIVKGPIVAIIRGGVNRYVMENSTFFLDASPSFDPDNLNAKLDFDWSFPPRANITTERLHDELIEVRASNLETTAELTVTVWSGRRNATQRIRIAKSDKINANIILDCPSCDTGYLNPSRPTRLMEKCNSGYCPSNNHKTKWYLYELREKAGNPKLQEIKCTGGNPLPQSLWKLTYEEHKCEHAKVSSRATNPLCERLTTPLASSCAQSTKEIQLVLKSSKPTNSEYLEIKNNTFPGNRIFTIQRVHGEFPETTVARRYFHVQDTPRSYSCRISPTRGVELRQDFNVICDNVEKNARLIYKVMYQRASVNGTTLPNIFFQRKVPHFKFHLPSGAKVKKSIVITMENENGVVREYCGIDVTVTALVPGDIGSSIEEYLYNRSKAVNDWFPEHPYSFHSQTLYNITLITDVLNRQPTVLNSTNLFYLRTRIREMMIRILSKVTVSSEYVSRQFAISLESCTRIQEELTSTSTATVVKILHKLMTRKQHRNERSLDVSIDFQESFLAVANRIKSKTSDRKNQLKLLESLTRLFQDILRTKFVRNPLEIFDVERREFIARYMKFSPYHKDNIRVVLKLGGGRVMLKISGNGVFMKRYYDCDLFGCGLQVVTMETDPFRDGDIYQKISSLTKLKVHNCKQGKIVKKCGKMIAEVRMIFPIRFHNTHNCKQVRNPGKKITDMRMICPIRFHNSTPEYAKYRLSSRENHLYTFVRNSQNVLNIVLVPDGPFSKKLKLRARIRCSDRRYQYEVEPLLATSLNSVQNFLSPKFDEYDTCKRLNVSVDLYWEVEPTKYELLQTEVMYTLYVRSLYCLSKKSESSNWEKDSCSCDMGSSPIHSLNCSCPELEGGDYNYIFATKTVPSKFKRIVVESKTNGVISVVMLVLSLCYSVAVFVLFIKERQMYKNSFTPIPLERCDPSHTHKYKITVYTGHCCGAQTTAKVAVVLYGENNASYPVELFTKNRELFRRNSRDVFVVSVRENLGSLNCIHIWHDNSGSSPSWFVDKLIIKDLTTNEKWIFRCSRWLAVDKNDEMLDCKIKPFDVKRGFTFKEFQLTLGEKLMDVHVWLSLVRMPTYSIFIRAERLTCCITLVFGYLFFNAYFSHIYKKYVIVDCVSVFNPTMSQFKTGFLTNLVCLPIYLFISSVFRYSKSFFWLQFLNNAAVASYTTDPVIKRKMHKPSTVQKCDKIVSELDHSSQDKRHKKLVLAALVVKSLYDDEESASNQVNLSSEDQGTTSMAGAKASGDSGVITSESHTNIENELSSNTSEGSWLQFSKTSLFRFPLSVNVLMWLGCVVMLFLSSLYTVEYVGRFDDITLKCFVQSVFWSLFISIFISQPLQALLVTVIQMIRRHCMFRSTMIDEAGQEIEANVVLDDSMFASFTEKNFEDPLYRKLFCLKYLQPLSRKVVARSRCKVLKRKATVMFLRDVLVYSTLLVFLYAVNPFWNQSTIFLHNNGLETFLNRQVKTNSSLVWWSSGPSNFLDTIKFDEKTMTLTAFQQKALVVGNPEMTMIFTYCQNNISYQNGSVLNERKRNCTKKVEERVIRFQKSQKKNWLGLNNSFHEIFNEYVTDIAMKLVIYSPSLNVFSVITLSSHTIVPSALVENDVSIATAALHLNRSSSLSMHVICELLYTLVPILLLIRQVGLYSATKSRKKRTNLGVEIEFLIVFLSFYSVILMWIWVKYQYRTLCDIWRYQYEANIVNGLEMIYKYQEMFKYSIALMLFFGLIKVCHVIGLHALLDCHVETFTSVIGSLLFSIFTLIVVLVAFAHVGVLLFGDHLRLFGTFLQAFSLNVMYLRSSNAENLIVDSSRQQMLITVYVIAFCVCMVVFSSLVKAAFCQAHINFLITVKNRRRIPLKVYFFRKIRRVISLLWSYLQPPKDKQESLKRVPMRYIFKELEEQLNDLEFRLTHLTCKANMPSKAAVDYCSSSDGSDVEYVYKGENERPSFSNYQHDLSSSTTTRSNFEYPTEVNMLNANVECISGKSSDAGSMTTHAETIVSNPCIRRRPFERTMRAFPRPMNETISNYYYPQVLLNPWEDDREDHAEREKTAENIVLVEQKPTAVVSEDTKIGAKNTDASTYIVKVKDIYGSGNSKKKKSGPARPKVIVNDFTNNACESDVEDFYGNLTPGRPKVCLDAFERRSFSSESDGEYCSHPKT